MALTINFQLSTLSVLSVCVFLFIFAPVEKTTTTSEKLFLHVLTIAKSLMMMRNDETLSSSLGEMRDPKKQHLITLPGERAMRGKEWEKVLIELHSA